jgi:protein tyrosine phosphatase (PTP) superfamily phosphohydrolase (DUF442 family)
MALEHIKNFVLVSPSLATAGQPSETQLREIAEAGFEVVINLGLCDPSYCLPDEACLVQSLGLGYHHIPVDFQAPQPKDLERFFSVMDGIQAKKVFIHCAANKRVSCFVALYGQARFGWSHEKANALISRIWQPGGAWDAFISLVRQQLEENRRPPPAGIAGTRRGLR